MILTEGKETPRRFASFLWAVVLIWAGIGCLNLPAQVIPSEDHNQGTADEFEPFADEFGASENPARGFDPLEPYNRFMFRVNDSLYVWVFKPVAQAYGGLVPTDIRRAVTRVFQNIEFPIHVTNNLLQGDFADAGANITRFGINTTLGLAGTFDAADTCLGLKRQPEDFGQTLGRYGVNPGPPLVLPVMGMSNCRDAVGKVPDGMLNPVNYADSPYDTMCRMLKMVNMLSLNWQFYDELKEEALDEYVYLRDLYRQNREKKLKE